MTLTQYQKSISKIRVGEAISVIRVPCEKKNSAEASSGCKQVWRWEMGDVRWEM